MANLILPDDPDFKKPITMGNPYQVDPGKELHEQGITPGTKRAELERQRDLEANGNFKYASSSFVSAPEGWNHQMMKTSQAAGVSNMMTQPMWFSPLHTPQNWQIASKRREVYQWLYLPCSQVLTEDYTFQDMSEFIENVYTNEIIEDTLTGGVIYENIECSSIMGATGEFRQPIRASERHCKEKTCYSFSATGFWRKVSISEEHKIAVLDGQSFRRRKKLLRSRQNRRDNGIPKGGDKPECDLPEVKIVYKEAHSVQTDDFLICPVPECGDVSLSKERSWLLGQLLSDGHRSKREHGCSVGFTINTHDAHKEYLVQTLESEFPGKVRLTKHGDKDGDGIRISQCGKEEWRFFSDYITGTLNQKKLLAKAFDLDQQSRLHLLGGFFDGDGSFTKEGHKLTANIYSQNMADQLFWILLSCGVRVSLLKHKLTENHYPTSSEFVYAINIPSSDVPILQPFMKSDKIPQDFVPKKSRALRFFYEENDIKYLVAPISQIDRFVYTGIGYDLEVNPEKALLASGYAVSNCRFFYENEPKVAAAIDFYSRFPMNGFNLECRNTKVLKFFEHHVAKKLNLNERFKEISSEYYMIGDVFIHTDINCPNCFPENTMITTENGHKPIQSVRVGDKVLCLDESYHDVEATMSRKYIGDMIDFKISHLPNLVCTEDHNVYAVRGFYYEYGNNRRMIDKKLTNFDDIQKIKAKDLNAGDYVVVPIQDEYKKYDQIQFDQSEYYVRNKSSRPSFTLEIDHDLAKLFAWYVGEGSTDSNRTVHFSLNGMTEHDVADWIIATCKELFGIEFNKSNYYKESCLQVVGYNRALSAWLDELCGHGANNKRVPFFIFHSNNEIKQTFINNLQFADGHSRKDRKEKNITTVSRTLTYDLIRLLHSVGESPFVTETPDRTDDRGIHHRHAYNVCWTPDKTKEGKGSFRNENYQYYRILDIRQFHDDTTVYNFSVQDQHNYVAGGLYVKNCNGTAKDIDTGEECSHEGGMFNRIFVMNPDWIEVQKSPLTDEPLIVMIPDEELQQIVHKRQPKAIYDRIPDQLKGLIIARAPIPMSNRTTTHLKHMAVPYGTYGTSIIRRLFTTLAYKTKIMTANWIVAERLILPVRVVKVGSDNRPATSTDIADIQQQLAATANDPNLTIVTHHNFEYEWYGTSGKVLQITQEMEHIDKELLDGLMLNQALLNGEMCHSEDTEVLTDSGFKNYKNVYTNDKIACYNVYTNQVEYEFPTALHEYDYDGELIHFSGKRLDIKVTPNHKMLVSWDKSSWKTTTADSVKNGMRLIGASEFENITDIQYPVIHNNDEHSVDLIEKFIPLNVFAKFAGYYISEGSSYAKKSNYHLHVYQSQKKAKIHKSIKSNFDDMGFNYGIYNYRDDGHDQFTISNKDFVLFMREHFGHGSHFKCIPTWLKNIPKEYLETLLFALVEGDGSVRSTNLESYSYSSVSKQLIDDVQEIALKCGFSAKSWVQDKQCESSFGKSTRYWVHFSRGKNSNGSFPVVRKQHINKVPYKGKVWCFTTPTGFFVTRRNGKIAIQGNSGYQSAQVGVETLIRRIESWRHSLAEWCEERVFRPIAEMQGFIDEEESEAVGETVFLYPRIKWNDLDLKDKSQFHQLLTQLHDKQVISTQTLLEELDLDYDQEVMRMRYEQAQLGPAGAAMGGDAMGGAGGGAMGGMPGGAASPEQGGMGGGMDMGGGMGGDMGGGMGGDMGGGAAPMASGGGGKITKKGKNKQEEEMIIPTMPINLTKIEQKMRGMLEKVAENMHFNLNNVRMQFPVENPHGGKPYTLDFAIPAIKMAIETDGQAWHSTENQVEHDKERDFLLAQRGWTVLRFDDRSIDESPQQVEATVHSYISKLMSHGKKASNGSSLRKISYFICPDNKMQELGSDDDKYYKYLNIAYPSRRVMHLGDNIGHRSKEEYFKT